MLSERNMQIFRVVFANTNLIWGKDRSEAAVLQGEGERWLHYTQGGEESGIEPNYI